MAATVFVHDGDAIDYTPGADVASGDVVVQGELVGVAKLDIKANKLGPLDALRGSTVPGWGIVLRDAESIVAEARWIADQGWTLTQLTIVHGLLQAVIEGRRDLLPVEGK